MHIQLFKYKTGLNRQNQWFKEHKMFIGKQKVQMNNWMEDVEQSEWSQQTNPKLHKQQINPQSMAPDYYKWNTF